MVMRRALTNLTNPLGNPVSASDGVDDPLTPSTSAATLANGPQVTQGLVADGVTPLVLQLNSGGSSTPINYTITVTAINGLALPSQLSSNLNLQVLSNGTWNAGTTVAISSTQPGFFYIPAIDPSLIDFTNGAEFLSVELSIQRSDGTGSSIALTPFYIRKPPMVLVHGYNVDPTASGTINGWPTSFLNVLDAQIGADFVTPITYAGKADNTIDPLEILASKLDQTLSQSSGVEDSVNGPFAGYAMTRYDLVCHSQGGVLARMLCTYSLAAPNAQHTPFGTATFRNSNNFYRGRFRRIVTIGSPQNGTRLAHYLFNLKNSNNKWYQSLPSILSWLGVLQGKFDPFGLQIQTINSPSLAVDPSAKFHLISTEIANGLVPGVSLPTAYPPSYVVSGLASDVPGQTYTRGQIVTGGSGGPTPFASDDIGDGGGSDGVVDIVSQQGGTGNASISSLYTSQNVAHADVTVPYSEYIVTTPTYFFGVPLGQSDTSYPAMATTVAGFLNASSSGGSFGPFTLPTLLTASTQSAIDAVTPSLSTKGQIAAQGDNTNNLTFKSSMLTAGITNYSYTLTPDASEPIQGTVTWSAEVYAPGGITSNGVTISVNANDSTQVTVSVASSVVGEVVLLANYTSTTGDLVAPTPIVVVSIPSTATQTGISLSPSPAPVVAGETPILELDNVYNDGTSQPVFLSAASPAQFGSSNTNLLTVDSDGTLHPLAPGQVTVTASYGGFSTQDTVTIVAPGLGPQISSSGTALGTVGSAFTYHITALQNPTSFGVGQTGLPPGLTINTTSGLISGTPTTPGTYTVTTIAANASSQDTNTLVITIASAPTPNSFALWESGYSFAGTATATSQHDGVSNGLKYLYDINPTRPMTAADRAGLPSMGVDTTTTPGTTYLEFTYRQYAALTGVTINLQTSPDLQNWTTVTPDISQEIGTDSTTGDPIMELGVNLNGAARLFIRLDVTGP
jgi:hypothetical protein